MIKMMRADFGRIARRIPRNIFMILVLLVEVASFYIVSRWTQMDSFDMVFKAFLKMIPFAFGMIELGFVYGDDVKAKMMQISIGSGVSRSKLILGKWLETAILLAFDFAAVILVGCAFATVKSIAIQGLLKAVILTAGKGWLTLVVYLTISTIFVYLLQTTGIATMVFLFLQFGIVDTAISMLGLISKLEWLHLEELTVSYFLDHVATQPLYIVGILAYILISFIITIMVYGGKELEF